MSSDLPPVNLHSGLIAATSNYMLARLQAPRHWEEITTSPSDQCAILAAANAAFVAREASEDALVTWVLAARRAGITWGELGDRLGAGNGEETRHWFLHNDTFGVGTREWPDEQTEEIAALLQPDTGEGR